MRSGIWPSVGTSFGILLSLVALFAWLVARKSAEIDDRMKHSHQLYQRADDAITEIRADIYRGALLERSQQNAAESDAEHNRLAFLQSEADRAMAILSSLLGATQHAKLAALRSGLSQYWRSFSTGSAVVSHEKILSLAEEIDALNEANLGIEQQQIQAQQRYLRDFAVAATGALFVAGLAVAIATTAYLAKMERISGTEKLRAENAEYELRRLSNQLVRVQEEERKNISRELHDEVGQILTGLRMELGSLSRGEADGSFQQRLESVKVLAEDALRSVRNLALLLRPSMLDDLGLGPALRWQAKEFSRRSDISVSVNLEGDIENLPESIRICLYRAVQEALNNCMKHSGATRVTVTLKQERGLVTAVVQDDGGGFDPRLLRTQGLGLVGMEERVRALQGTLSVNSSAGQGTVVSVVLPLSSGLTYG